LPILQIVAQLLKGTANELRLLQLQKSYFNQQKVKQFQPLEKFSYFSQQKVSNFNYSKYSYFSKQKVKQFQPLEKFSYFSQQKVKQYQLLEK